MNTFQKYSNTTILEAGIRIRILGKNCDNIQIQNCDSSVFKYKIITLQYSNTKLPLQYSNTKLFEYLVFDDAALIFLECNIIDLPFPQMLPTSQDAVPT